MSHLSLPLHSRSPRDLRTTSGDGGITLIELVAAMSIMGIFMAMATPLVVRLYAMQRKIETMSYAQSQLNTVYLRLDAEVRYAAGLSAPGKVGADWYVEYLTTVPGTPTCVELRLTAAGQLQRRSWPQGSPPAAAFPVLASGVSAGASGPPFTVLNPDSSTTVQRLGVNLAASGPPYLTMVFTALNSSSGGPNVASCVTAGRS